MSKLILKEILPKILVKYMFSFFIISLLDFNETKLINYICNSGYELVFDTEPNERINITDAYLKGYYFKLKQ